MVLRRLQNVPLQDGTNRPISPTGPTRTSPRLVRSTTYQPATSSMPGTTGFRPPGSPTKRNMPYPVPLSNSLQLPMRRSTPFTSLGRIDAHEWNLSLPPARDPIAMIQRPLPFVPGTLPDYQQPAFDIGQISSDLPAHAQMVLNSLGSPTLLQSHNAKSHTSLNSASFTNSSIPISSTSSSGPVSLFHDDDGAGCHKGCNGCNDLPDDTSEDLPIVESIFNALPSNPIPSPPITNPSGLPHQTFEITFNVYQLKVPETDSVAGRTKKARGRTAKVAPKPAKPQWRNFKPLVPTYAKLPVGSFSWSDWRTKLFNACNKRLMGISNALEAAESSGTLAIQGFVNGTDRKKTKNRVYLTDDITFAQFVHAILAAPSNAFVGIKIVHPNPKTNEDANRSVASTLRASGANSPSDPSDDEDGSESEGSDSLTSAEKNYKTLMARFEKAFKSGENVATAVNPKDTSKILLLNTSRIRTWASDWADGVPGVDEVNPPMERPNFRWVNATDYEDEKAELLGLRDRGNRANQGQPVAPNSGGTVIHHNYYGQGFPRPGMPVASPFSTPNMMIPPVTTGSISSPVEAQTRLSIPTNIEHPDFNTFLTFAGIDEGMKKTRDALQNEGIDDFDRLLDRQTYSIHNLHSMGIPFAHAEDIFKAVPKFLETLKTEE